MKRTVLMAVLYAGPALAQTASEIPPMPQPPAASVVSQGAEPQPIPVPANTANDLSEINSKLEVREKIHWPWTKEHKPAEKPD